MELYCSVLYGCDLPQGPPQLGQGFIEITAIAQGASNHIIRASRFQVRLAQQVFSNRQGLAMFQNTLIVFSSALQLFVFLK